MCSLVSSYTFRYRLLDFAISSFECVGIDLAHVLVLITGMTDLRQRILEARIDAQR